jgi:hypothetical protein
VSPVLLIFEPNAEDPVNNLEMQRHYVRIYVYLLFDTFCTIGSKYVTVRNGRYSIKNNNKNIDYQFVAARVDTKEKMRAN